MTQTAFEVLVGNLSKTQLRQFRQDLVSVRGNLSSGRLAESMDLKLKDEERDQEILEALATSLLPAKTTTIQQLYLTKSGGAADFGFVFDKLATEQIIVTLSAIQTSHRLDLLQLSNNFLFKDEQKKNLWQQASASEQKKLIGGNLRAMIRKTDIQYRIHGDRLHYLVIGKVTGVYKQARQVWPLLLFAVSQVDEKNLQLEVEQTGFVNFWLDEKILGQTLTTILDGDWQIAIDEKLPAWLTQVKDKVEKLSLSNVDEVTVDPDFSLLGIITGFETEYVDRAWREILA